jgi:hypothetical protein
MIPRVYVWLDETPFNRAGKIDRRALAKMLDPALPPGRNTQPSRCAIHLRGRDGYGKLSHAC